MSGNTYRERRIALRPGAKIIGGVLVSVFVLVSLVLPGLTVLYTSLQKYYSVPSWSSLRRSSLDAYRDLFTDPTMLSVLKTTLLVALVTAVLTMVLSSVVSWFVIRSRPRFGRLMDSLAFVPHMLPSIVLGLAVLLIYVRIPAPIYGTMWIMVIALGTRYISLGTRQMNSGIGAIRAELEEAAAMSGASAVKTFRRVVLPLSLPSMANGFLLVSLLSIQNLSVPLLLGSGGNSVISVTIFNNWYNGETANPAALSTVLILVTIILAIAIRRASSLTRM